VSVVSNTVRIKNVMVKKCSGLLKFDFASVGHTFLLVIESCSEIQVRQTRVVEQALPLIPLASSVHRDLEESELSEWPLHTSADIATLDGLSCTSTIKNIVS
jgi:hypothetical protein